MSITRRLFCRFALSWPVSLAFLFNRADRASSDQRPEFSPETSVDQQQLLLNPRALRTESRVANIDEIRAQFLDPPTQFRSVPAWAWDDKMDPQRMTQQLRQFSKQGMGGVFIHPRPGLITEYLSKEWFDLWNTALAEARKLGISCNIYAENSYPTGFAGGHVPSLAPDASAQYVQVRLGETYEDIHVISDGDPWRGASTLAVFKFERDAKSRTVRAVRVQKRASPEPQGSLVCFSLPRAGGNVWLGNFPFVDLTNPAAGRMFIKTTFEAYERHVGEEFSTTLKWLFIDEPLLATDGTYEQSRLQLPLSFNTLDEFRKRNGYDLLDEIPSLFWDVGDWRKVRFDYWQTMHDLWKENFFAPIFLWCDRHSIQLTGHYMEHDWPYPWNSPDDASLYAYQHMPGIDMLVGAELRTKGVDPHMLFTIRQVSSVSSQLGRRTFVEAYAASGWDSTLEHYKRMGDWLMVNGINFVCQMAALTTIRGARKRDTTPSWSDVAAWWPFYRLHADYTARLCYVLSQGIARNRLLILEPTTSGFLWAQRRGETPDFQDLRDTYDLAVRRSPNGFMWYERSGNPELKTLRADFDELNQFLADHQVDFDLGDEFMIEWFGKCKEGKLVIARASYDLLVWPRGMINLRHQTVPVLEQYLQSGGEILAFCGPAQYVDGRPSDLVLRLQTRFPNQWHMVSNLQELLTEIHRRLPPRVEFEGELPPGIGHRMETFENGDRIHFFTNATQQAVSVEATVVGPAIEEWDTIAGKMGQVAYRSIGAGKIRFRLDLPPVGSHLFHVPKRRTLGHTAAMVEVNSPVTPLPFGQWKVTPNSLNVLVLDYCDLQVAGQTHQNINTWKANWIVWQAHGYERPAWDNSIQFRRRIVDHPPFPPDSGFLATFHFRVKDAQAADGALLALECPELYKVYVNGRFVDTSRAARWLDPHFKTTEIERWLTPGQNTVRIVASPFNVLMELENIYIRGNFAVDPDHHGFSIHASRPLRFGSWAKQGYPFYHDSVLYETKVLIPQDTPRIRISFPEWAGCVAEVLVDGERVGVVAWKPFEYETSVSPGSHTVGLRIVSTPRNLLGPFHCPFKPRMAGWSNLWIEFPEHQPPGVDYDLLDYGLMKPFSINAWS